MSLVLLLTFYAVALASGVAAAIAVRIPSWLGRTLVIITFAAAQILLAIQLLSLCHQLRATPLFALNAGMTALTFLFLRRHLGGFREWRFESLPVSRFVRENPIPALMLGTALVAAVLLEIIRAQLAPYGDDYHFAMPLFWRQHASVLPFPCTNPRVTGLALAAEALCFPGILYANSWVIFFVSTVVAKFLLCWLIADLARRLKASVGASVAAGAVFLTYAPLLYGSSDLLLAMVWIGAALFMLLEARRSEETAPRYLGLSAFCLLMSCGTKNAASLQAPLFLLFILWVCGRRLWTWPKLRSLMLGGILGLAISTTAWVYINNLRWFHDARGPIVLKETVSQDFRLTPTWTRIVRATVTAFSDPTWLPGSLQPAYAHALKKSAMVLGGSERLDEDDAYYKFDGEHLRPGAGLNALGPFLLAPSLLYALLVWRRARPSAAEDGTPRRLAGGLAMLCLLSFVLGFAVLKTQPSVARLLCGALIFGAPLAGILLERRWFRVAVFALQIGMTGAYAIYCLGGLVRRFPAAEQSWWGRQVSKLQRNHAIEVDLLWSDRPQEKLILREDYSSRELIETALARMPSPTTVGSMSYFNAEDVHLFGRDFQNKVICLVDSKDPAHAYPVPPEVDFIVSDRGDFADLDYAARGFSIWLKTKEEGRSFTVLKRQGK